jgi:hypothetical protein
MVSSGTPANAANHQLNYSFTPYSHPISFGLFFDEPLVVGAGDTVDVTIRFDQPYKSIRPFQGAASVSLFSGLYNLPRRSSVGTATMELFSPVNIPNTYEVVDIDVGGGSGDLAMHAMMEFDPQSTAIPVAFGGIRVVYNVTSGPT